MALTADNVVVGITGKVYVGATTASAPTSSASTLTCLLYTSPSPRD